MSSQFVVLGDTATIVCHSPVVWWEFQSNSDHRSVLIFNGHNKVDISQVKNFNVTSSEDDESHPISILSLYDVQLNYAGMFRCNDPGDDTKKLLEHELGILGGSESYTYQYT